MKVTRAGERALAEPKDVPAKRTEARVHARKDGFNFLLAFAREGAEGAKEGLADEALEGKGEARDVDVSEEKVSKKRTSSAEPTLTAIPLSLVQSTQNVRALAQKPAAEGAESRTPQSEGVKGSTTAKASSVVASGGVTLPSAFDFTMLAPIPKSPPALAKETIVGTEAAPDRAATNHSGEGERPQLLHSALSQESEANPPAFEALELSGEDVATPNENKMEGGLDEKEIAVSRGTPTVALDASMWTGVDAKESADLTSALGLVVPPRMDCGATKASEAKDAKHVAPSRELGKVSRAEAPAETAQNTNAVREDEATAPTAYAHVKTEWLAKTSHLASRIEVDRSAKKSFESPSDSNGFASNEQQSEPEQPKDSVNVAMAPAPKAMRINDAALRDATVSLRTSFDGLAKVDATSANQATLAAHLQTFDESVTPEPATLAPNAETAPNGEKSVEGDPRDRTLQRDKKGLSRDALNGEAATSSRLTEGAQTQMMHENSSATAASPVASNAAPQAPTFSHIDRQTAVDNVVNQMTLNNIASAALDIEGFGRVVVHAKRDKEKMDVSVVGSAETATALREHSAQMIKEIEPIANQVSLRITENTGSNETSRDMARSFSQSHGSSQQGFGQSSRRDHETTWSQASAVDSGSTEGNGDLMARVRIVL